MKMKCNVIRDLIPLYIDGLLSDDSLELVDSHIRECGECENTLRIMREEVKAIDKLELERNIKAQKPFKKIKRKMVLSASIIIIVSLLAGIFISKPIGTFSPDALAARGTVDKFLTLVEEKRYDEAFKYVYYFDEASDIAPKISYDEAKRLWVERFKEFDAKSGDEIINHKHITTRMDDGYLKGKVEIQVENDFDKDYHTVEIWFARMDGKWRIGNFYNGGPRYTFEIVLSGSLTEQDRKQNYAG